MARNRLGDLLAYQPAEGWQAPRQAFLREALQRIERGETVYTLVQDGRLVHYGWIHQRRQAWLPEVGLRLELPEGAVTFYDFYTHPQYRGRGFYQSALRHMLAETAASPQVRQIHIAVLAGNAPSRRSIEKVGFLYAKSFFRRVRLFSRKSWSVSC
jgi:RimJ/RimL family protein N-acetyltransferase